jgi:hypothetical protein
MCMMCEQEALYDAYLEYVARKEAEAAAKGETLKGAAFKAETFSAEAIDGDAADELTAVHAAPAATPKEN